MIHIDPELKQRIINQRIMEGRTFKSLEDEYGISHGTISRWVAEYRESAKADDEKYKALAAMEENRKLKEELAELKKENDFLKKAAAFFAKESK